MRRQQPRPLLQPARLDQDILNQIPTSNLRQHTHRDPIRQPDQRTINSTRSHTAILEQPPIRDHHDTPNDPPNLAALEYAEVEGYSFATIYHEYDDSGQQSALEALIEELHRAEAQHIVI